MRGFMLFSARACLFASLTLVVSGCTSVKVAPEELDELEGMSFELVPDSGLDEYGRPVFGDALKEHPSEPGSLFVILARDENGFVQRSFLVAATKPDSPDMAEPLNSVYKWTGKGFKRAGRFLENLFTGAPCYDCHPAVEMYLLVAATGVTISVAGGFVIGIADGTWEAGKEIGKLTIRSKEVMVSFSTYEYDYMGRLSRVRSFTPEEPPREIISTYFRYDEEDTTPAQATTSSPIDNTSHTEAFKH